MITTIIFDLGGVLVRTEDQGAPHSFWLKN